MGRGEVRVLSQGARGPRPETPNEDMEFDNSVIYGAEVLAVNSG